MARGRVREPGGAGSDVLLLLRNCRRPCRRCWSDVKRERECLYCVCIVFVLYRCYIRVISSSRIYEGQHMRVTMRGIITAAQGMRAVGKCRSHTLFYTVFFVFFVFLSLAQIASSQIGFCQSGRQDNFPMSTSTSCVTCPAGK